MVMFGHRRSLNDGARTKNAHARVICSGVSVAFSMTKLAACGRTLEEIVKVLELDSVSEKTSDRVHFYFARLLCRLRRRKDASDRLLVANRLFVDRSLRLDAAYQNISRRVYGADVMALDFRGEPEASRAAINAWVANETKNHIRDALPAGAVRADAVLVLVNSIYFKGRWLNEFHRDDVYAARFHVDAGRSCSVRMMFQENKFRYARLPERRLQLLEMEYRGRDVALTLLLPDRGDTLARKSQNCLQISAVRMDSRGGGGARASHAERVVGQDGGDDRVGAPSAIPPGGESSPQGGAQRARTAPRLQPAKRQPARAPGGRRRRRVRQRRLPQGLPGGERARQRGVGVVRRGGVGKIHQVGRPSLRGRSALPAPDPRDRAERRPLRGPRGAPLSTLRRPRAGTLCITSKPEDKRFTRVFEHQQKDEIHTVVILTC
ncbi:antithrombin-III isoform X3 [Phycodurus eques]|uniref:antithrombin-III isoform X3 n=1 Tax=Phycodurus eques TaxID=693459 RepID=UPI002ACEEDA6|nr:antithrombin-III isoform X3 [Phycodurus eques]